MTPRFVIPKRQPAWLRPVRVVACLAALVVADHAGAAAARNERRIESIESRAAGAPVMAIISLRSQRITVYDADGWILRAPVSSGQKGRETPAGIFSVIQKEAEHYSNLYDDAYMPHMQRITWSGIALHGGPLPGHAASHGCVRLPYDFAARLFDATRLGMRVIVAPGDVAPVEIAHPALLAPKPGAAALAATRAAEADEATRKADQARLAATRLADVEAQLAAAKAELQPNVDAAAAAREALAAAEAARGAAVQASREAARELEPVSVFISRKTQRLYVRRAFQPVLESPVEIKDADRPIGTHLFTAMARTNRDTDMRWSVVSLDGDGGAKSALDRIVIPQDVLDRIAGMASPRSSLIVSDEELSRETGTGTDFVVLMSGEPQGGIKFRRRAPAMEARYGRRTPWGWPFAGGFSRW